MIRDDKIINELMYGDIVKDFANSRNIGLTEARAAISQMSFSDYHRLVEAGTAITPPSGNAIGPTSSNTGNNQQNNPAQNSPTKTTPAWSGKGPVTIGMQVGMQGDNNTPVPGIVSSVDPSTQGVVIKDPVTGKQTTLNMKDLQPFATQATQGQTAVEEELRRMRQLAGIKENCSAGATGAGAIAVAPVAMGKMKKRQYPEESLKAEYTPSGPVKTIIGDTKPNQASGKLSADLAASGKKTAARPNRQKK
jgi:hypothetical protein